MNMIGIEQAAKAAHNAIKRYCEDNGDNSIDDWEKANDNIKQSAIDGVKYLMANPHASSKDMHDNWVKFKKKDGWVYGETKDTEKKTHPSITDYKNLSAIERKKDEMFIAVAKGFIPSTGDTNAF